MCNYCGCRSFPAIARLTEEHEGITEAAGRLRAAISTGHGDPVEPAEALDALDALLELLAPHTVAEESGLFAELGADGGFAEEVDKLCAEHEAIHQALVRVDRAAPEWAPVLAALDRLRRHIDAEQYGLFPAAAFALPISAWDRLTPAQ